MAYAPCAVSAPGDERLVRRTWRTGWSRTLRAGSPSRSESDWGGCGRAAIPGSDRRTGRSPALPGVRSDGLHGEVVQGSRERTIDIADDLLGRFVHADKSL